jgi:hypothetical protein
MAHEVTVDPIVVLVFWSIDQVKITAEEPGAGAKHSDIMELREEIELVLVL